MPQKYNTAFFEKDEQIYKQKFEFLYKDVQDTRETMYIGFNINEQFFSPLGAEITSILETNPDLSFELFVFVDTCNEQNKENLQKTAQKY